MLGKQSGSALATLAALVSVPVSQTVFANFVQVSA